jgi:uncharacterized RDD family membrane protein YckC
MFVFGIFLGVAFTSSIDLETGEPTAAIGGVMLLYLVSFGVIFAYYTFLEGSSKGKTIGKMITKTKVIREDGEPMTFGKAFLRTLCRLVPFEFISAFFAGGQMWHDSWTGTRVVKDR